MGLNRFVNDNLPYLLAVSYVMLLILLIMFFIQMLRIASMKRKYKKMMCGVEGKNLEEVIIGCINTVKLNDKKVEDLFLNYQRLANTCISSIQKVGIVRFNAFEDTGSDLSFAIALLNGKDNGIVISSIYGRAESRIYSKPISAGQSSYYLTTEEKEAIEQAQNSKTTFS